MKELMENEESEQKHGRALNPRLMQYALFLWEVAKVVAISLVIIIPVRYFLIQPFYVKGASMEPNFFNYEYLIINELSYRFHEPSRGDVIVLRNPARESEFFIKRVIGLPGETVTVRDFHVYINDTLIDESAYLESSVKTISNRKPVTLEKGEYFVLGDNRDESLDSRYFGPIPKKEIVGRAWIRAWPWSRLARFTRVEYPGIEPPVNLEAQTK